MSEAVDMSSIRAFIGDADGAVPWVDSLLRRRAVADEIIRRVAARHALRAEVVRSVPKSMKAGRHIVMARAQAAHAMNEVGFSRAHIGKALSCDRGTASRMVQKWKDHLAGRLHPVSDDQALRVQALVRRGFKTGLACDVVGVAVSRYEERAGYMRRVRA